MGSIARSRYYPSQERQSSGRPAPGLRPFVVVVFGRTGVGISSLVNLIAGHPVSNVHSNAKTSAQKIKPYPPIQLPGSEKLLSLYELPGFCGQFSDATIMEAIRHIERLEGIDLFVYCLRSQKTTVISKIVRQIRDSFSAPMIAVVTELERFNGSDVGPNTDPTIVRMEDWWCTSLEDGGDEWDADRTYVLWEVWRVRCARVRHNATS
ncbi:hypothetical protein JVU11DRAFT_10041 [Chiua virens]|nr:hypothetical protein JVU11DRAFT_10041 [Chiua virens]